MPRKLGYTFYPKDWQTDMKVFNLSMEQRFVYRELIDRAMINDNKVKLETSNWGRLWGVSSSIVDRIVVDLHSMGLLKYLGSKDYVIIPSCEKRLFGKRNGRNGGVSTAKGTAKGTAKSTLNDTPKEKEKEKEKYKVDDFINWFNDSITGVKGILGRFKATNKVRRQYKARIKDGYNLDDFKRAFKAISTNKFHKEEGFKFLTPEFITRADMLEKWCNAEVIEKKSNNAHLFMS